MSKSAGFTLIEMLVALAVTSLLMVAGSTLLIQPALVNANNGSSVENPPLKALGASSPLGGWVRRKVALARSSRSRLWAVS